MRCRRSSAARLQTLEADGHPAGYADTKNRLSERVPTPLQPRATEVGFAVVRNMASLSPLSTLASTASSGPDQRAHFLLRFLEALPQLVLHFSQCIFEELKHVLSERRSWYLAHDISLPILQAINVKVTKVNKACVAVVLRPFFGSGDDALADGALRVG